MDNKKINVEIPEAGAVPGGIYENPATDRNRYIASGARIYSASAMTTS